VGLCMKILITGGAGFIGSTIASALSDVGHSVVVLDNLLTGKSEFASAHRFYLGDIADEGLVRQVWLENPDIDAVIHCAARIVVPESVRDPYSYYFENVAKSLQFFYLVQNLGCKRIVFSSSASVYGQSASFEVTESTPFNASSPYARTKMMMECILQDFTVSAPSFRAIALRYFNPIGADPHLRTGLQLQYPSHALGKIFECHKSGEPFQITGTNWPTRDGSGVRDYIHVWDLARAHVLAVEKFDPLTVNHRYKVINLGTGNGTTVFELVKAFEEVTGKPLPVIKAPPREGDVAGSYTVSQVAKLELGWTTQLSIADAIRDSFSWLAVRQERFGY
jgi:UDP-glucose 4-epimerase